MAGADYPRGVKLGVDVGLVRVGLANCDPDGMLATPLRTLKRDPKKNSDVAVLLQVAAERSAVQIVVGLPRSLNGGENPSTRMAREYARLVAAALATREMDIPVVLMDERLSTVSAHRSLSEAGLKTRNHRKVVDQVAAAAILQQTIDMQRSLGRDVGEPVAAGRTGTTDSARDLNQDSDPGQPAPMEEPTISGHDASGKDK